MKGLRYVSISQIGMVKIFLKNLPKPQFVAIDAIETPNNVVRTVWYQANSVVVNKHEFMTFLRSKHHSGNWDKFVEEENGEHASLTDDGISYCAKMGYSLSFE